jgi:ArsR family transcriptional regulator, arsenate/arsenite/antimonite-responsive transcriptional repressor
LRFGLRFHIIGIMETTQAVQSLGALAQETRLAIFRLLVQAGPAGMAAGQIGDKLDLAPATLSFHLAGLTRAGLAQSRQEGRFVIYTVNFESMTSLVAFLTENCCGGRSCIPSTGDRDEKIPRARRRA